MPPLYFLHGFLGAPEDWDGVIKALGYGTPLPYPFEPPGGGILVGYSMGGRIALKYSGTKIIISASLGYESEEERVQRRHFEAKTMEALETLPFEAFVRKWYEQPLFESLRRHPIFEEVFQRRVKVGKEKAIEQLRAHPLEPRGALENTSTQLIYGEWDPKYAEQGGIRVAKAGHACHLENPEGCASAILEALQHSLSSGNSGHFWSPTPGKQQSIF